MQIDIDYRQGESTALTFIFDAGSLVSLAPVDCNEEWDHLEEAVDTVCACLAQGMSEQYFDTRQELELNIGEARHIAGTAVLTLHFQAGAPRCHIDRLLAVLEENGYRAALKTLFYHDRFQQRVEISTGATSPD